jgi:hypothetical protein
MPEEIMTTPTETPVVETPTRVERKPKVTKRAAEALQEIAPTKMTDAEKNDYIKFLREENNKLTFQADAFAKNAQSAFDQYRNLEKKYTEFKLKANAKLNWARECVDHARTSIILAGNIEEE